MLLFLRKIILFSGILFSVFFVFSFALADCYETCSPSNNCCGAGVNHTCPGGYQLVCTEHTNYSLLCEPFTDYTDVGCEPVYYDCSFGCACYPFRLCTACGWTCPGGEQEICPVCGDCAFIGDCIAGTVRNCGSGVCAGTQNCGTNCEWGSCSSQGNICSGGWINIGSPYSCSQCNGNQLCTSCQNTGYQRCYCTASGCDNCEITTTDISLSDCDYIDGECGYVAPPSCNNECAPSGTTECNGNNIRTCGNYDGDNCLEWSSYSSCGTVNCTAPFTTGSCNRSCLGTSCQNCAPTTSDCSCLPGHYDCNNSRGNGSDGCESATPCNNPPTANNLSADSPNSTDYCGIRNFPPVRVRWIFSDTGDTQSAFQIQADYDPGFSSPIAADTGKLTDSCAGNCGQYVFQVAGIQLSWNTNYYWRIKVWDSQDVPSNWTLGPQIVTPSHAWPIPDFSFLPQNPVLNETVVFTDASNCYLSPGNIEGYCSTTAGTVYLWSFGNGQTSPRKGYATTSYNSNEDKTVSLKITDLVGACTTTKIVSVGSSLPEYREIPPFSWIRNFFADISRTIRNLFK